MSNIKESIRQLDEPEKSIGRILIEFYETMKELEGDKERGGKQATLIVMTISDLTELIPHKKTSIGKQYISTSDGKACFPRSEYLAHEIRLCGFAGVHELIIWTKTWVEGRIHRYDTLDEATAVSKEIIKQLNEE